MNDVCPSTLIDARALAANLNHARVRHLAGDLYPNLDLDRDLARIEDRLNVLALEFGPGLAYGRIHDRARDLVFALNYARHRAQVFGRARARARARAQEFERYRLGSSALGFTFTRALFRAMVRVIDASHHPRLARSLVRACNRAGEFAAAVEGLGIQLPSAAVRPSIRPVRVAGRLTQAALRVLPPVNRPRYDEEFCSELYELAAAGASRRAQVAYAVRLLDRAWVLRAELRTVVVRRARP